MTGACDTGVKTVLALLECTEHATISLRGAPITRAERIILFTDETDPSYVANLSAAVAARYTARGGSFTHGDALLASLLPHADNFIIYAALGAIADGARTVLRFGYRGACEKRGAVRSAAIPDVRCAQVLHEASRHDRHYPEAGVGGPGANGRGRR
jgi:hypothetical protein